MSAGGDLAGSDGGGADGVLHKVALGGGSGGAVHGDGDVLGTVPHDQLHHVAVIHLGADDVGHVAVAGAVTRAGGEGGSSQGKGGDLTALQNVLSLGILGSRNVRNGISAEHLPLTRGAVVDKSNGIAGGHILGSSGSIVRGQNLGVLIKAVHLGVAVGIGHRRHGAHFDLGVVLQQLVLDQRCVGQGHAAVHDHRIDSAAILDRRVRVDDEGLLGTIGQQQLHLVVDALGNLQNHTVVADSADDLAGHIVGIAVKDELVLVAHGVGLSTVIGQTLGVDGSVIPSAVDLELSAVAHGLHSAGHGLGGLHLGLGAASAVEVGHGHQAVNSDLINEVHILQVAGAEALQLDLAVGLGQNLGVGPALHIGAEDLAVFVGNELDGVSRVNTQAISGGVDVGGNIDSGAAGHIVAAHSGVDRAGSHGRLGTVVIKNDRVSVGGKGSHIVHSVVELDLAVGQVGGAGILQIALGDAVHSGGAGVEDAVNGVILVGLVGAAGGAVLEDDLELLADVGNVQIEGEVGGLHRISGLVVSGQPALDLDLALGSAGSAGAVVALKGADQNLRTELGAQQGVVAQLIALGHLAGGGIQGPVTLHHLGLDGIVGHLGGVVTGDGLGHGHIAQILIETGLVGVTVGVGLPAVAGEAKHSGVVAHGGQEHLGGLAGSQGALGIELAGPVAVDDAHAGAVLNVRLSPVIVDITVGGDQLGADVGLHAAVHDVGDDLGHLGPGQGAIGIEVAAVFLTADDVQSHHGIDSLFVLDLTRIGEILARSAGRDDHHAHDQGHGHHQTESPLEVSHRKFLLLNFCPLRGGDLLSVSPWELDLTGGPERETMKELSEKKRKEGSYEDCFDRPGASPGADADPRCRGDHAGRVA